MKPFLKTSFDLCTGCEICCLACAERLLGGFNPRRAVLRISHERENLYHFPIVCNQCENPYCAHVCPVEAISRDGKTGALVVDRETCIGCGLCGQYCPLEVVMVDPELGKSIKCDLCEGDPVCAQACPTGALVFVRPGGGS